jgi:multidrug efflux pump subunit AcrB
LAVTQNDLQEQYLRHLEELTSSQFGPILGQVVSMVPGLILIASRVFWGGWSLAITDGVLAPTVRTMVVTPASYVVWFHGKERDTGNVIMA